MGKDRPCWCCLEYHPIFLSRHPPRLKHTFPTLEYHDILEFVLLADSDSLCTALPFPSVFYTLSDLASPVLKTGGRVVQSVAQRSAETPCCAGDGIANAY